MAREAAVRTLLVALSLFFNLKFFFGPKATEQQRKLFILVALLSASLGAFSGRRALQG
jgi:hypothetical protein